MESLFKDKASLILRYMLYYPNKKWVVRDFSAKGLVGHGWAHKVFKLLQTSNYAHRHKQGRNSYLTLTNPNKLLIDWSKNYQFSKNITLKFFSDDPNIENKILRFLKDSFNINDYALNLFSAAKKTQPVWITNNTTLYLNPVKFNQIVRELTFTFKLRQLKTGGNIWLTKPYYKTSVFIDTHKKNNRLIVSNAQLYLDFLSLPGRGPEQAQVFLDSINNLWNHNNDN